MTADNIPTTRKILNDTARRIEEKGIAGDNDDDMVQCNSCAKIVPEEETTHGFAYGLEGTFCAECRGEIPDKDYIDKDYIQGAVSIYLHERSERK